MSTRCLLVAEADKIQNFVFRSARRREVVGASYLLKRFCEQFPRNLNLPEDDILTSAGGSFRLVFVSESDALWAQRELERQFLHEVAGTITTVVVRYDDNDPAGSVSAGNQALRRTKVAGRPAEPVWHLPVQALCASCGVELATRYEVLYEGEEGRYACDICREKARERRKALTAMFHVLRDKVKESRVEEPDDFLAVKAVYLPDKPDDADTYAWDARNYVVYMLADGNHMGRLFGGCQDRDALRLLSEKMNDATEQALAGAIYRMRPMSGERAKWDDKLPGLPLIMGGDDLFALLPASWAYDVAASFCRIYEGELQPVLDELDQADRLIMLDRNKVRVKPLATIGVAMVICKATYPYKLAYQHGEDLLDRAKEQAKLDKASRLSVDLITGSDIATYERRAEPLVLAPDEAFALLNWRLDLNSVPSRTLERLRKLLAQGKDAGLDVWLKRIRQVDKENHKQITLALQELGDKRLLELLNHWDFAHDLTKKPEDYVMGRGEA